MRIRWILEYAGDGVYDVVRNGRRLRSNVTSETALRYLRKHRKPGETAMVEEKDGYRVPLSTLL